MTCCIVKSSLSAYFNRARSPTVCIHHLVPRLLNPQRFGVFWTIVSKARLHVLGWWCFSKRIRLLDLFRVWVLVKWVEQATHSKLPGIHCFRVVQWRAHLVSAGSGPLRTCHAAVTWGYFRTLFGKTNNNVNGAYWDAKVFSHPDYLFSNEGEITRFQNGLTCIVSGLGRCVPIWKKSNTFGPANSFAGPNVLRCFRKTQALRSAAAPYTACGERAVLTIRLSWWRVCGWRIDALD